MTDARRRPNLFIIGAAKSGTTSLYEYLRGHPEVFMSSVKEPAYFASEATRGHRFVYGQDEAKYVDLFADALDERRLGEASTLYLYSKLAPGRIREFQPDSYIIAMLRNPVDMMASAHGQRIAMDLEEFESFEEALAADLEPGHGGPRRHAFIELGGTYRQRAMYGEQLQAWYDVFPRDRIHVIALEEFRASPADSFRGVLTFLGVDPDYKPESFAVHNARHRQRRGLARRLTRNRVTRWLVHDALPVVIGTSRSMRLARRVRRSRLTVTYEDRNRVNPALRERLLRDFRSDAERLSELVGHDFVSLWFQESGNGAS